MAVLELAQAETVVKFIPLSPYFMDITPDAISTIILGIKYGLNLGVPSPCANSLTCCWNVWIPPLPEPHITPILFLLRFSHLMLPCFMASSTAITAYWVNKSYFLASDLSM